jgi:lipopolysaccharide/colanic/teichoic acid biosynthesis glycosyltransferase
MAEARLGVLLRQTDRAGAEALANTLDTRLATISSRFPWQIYCYPEDQEGQAAIRDHAVSFGPSAMHTPHPSQDMLAIVAPAIPGWKRLTDLFIATTALIALSPLMLLTALYIKVVAPGPVFFRQERVGYLGRHFMCLKFRSMKLNAPTELHQKYLQQLIHSETPMKKLDSAHDKRIIPLGRFIRACAIDELPQLFNILRGDMSLVGPRPCMNYEFESYLHWHKRRFDTLPGLTGLWQVSGKNNTTFGEMMRLDIAYEQNRSFLQDLKIIFKTPLVLADQVTESMNVTTKEHTYESAH